MVVVMHTIMAILLAWRLGFAEYVGWLLKSQPNLKRVNFNLFFEDSPHGVAVRAIAVAPVPAARIEVEIATAEGAEMIDRRRPIEAVRADIAEGTVYAAT